MIKDDDDDPLHLFFFGRSLIQFQLVVLLNWGVLMLKIQLVRWSYVIAITMTSANILKRTLYPTKHSHLSCL